VLGEGIGDGRAYWRCTGRYYYSVIHIRRAWRLCGRCFSDDAGWTVKSG
jgi:hypothetical protein